jgi:putative transposase
MKAKLAFISAHCSTYSIRLLCSVLGVARSWFHDWQAGAQARSAESRTEADLVGQIRGIFQDRAGSGNLDSGIRRRAGII